MTRGSVPRVLVISISLVVSLLIPIPTQAAPSSNSVLKWQSTEFPDFAKISFPERISLSLKKCQTVPIRYEIDDALDTNNAVFVVQILNIEKKLVYGEIAWWGNMTVPFTAESLPLVGQLEVQVCRKKWNKEDRNYSAIRSKSYDVYFSYGRYEDDGTMGQKLEKRLKIKFKK